MYNITIKNNYTITDENNYIRILLVQTRNFPFTSFSEPIDT